MRRIAIISFVLAIVLSITGCVNFGEPARNESERIITKYGDEFTVAIRQLDFPSQKTFLTVTSKNHDATILSCRLEEHFSYYDYENDIVENWQEIIVEYQDSDIRVYGFHWGIIYSLDQGVTFLGVAKHDYSIWEGDERIKEIILNLK